MLRDLLVVVEVGKNLAPAFSFQLSQSYCLSPACVLVVPSPPALANVFGVTLVEHLVQKAKSKALLEADCLFADIRRQAEKLTSDLAIFRETGSLAEIMRRVARLARSYDMTILERPDSFAGVSSAVFESVLLASGRPVMIATGGGPATGRMRKVVLAWDGSPHASRALASLLGLFDDLEEIFVLTALNEKNHDELIPGADIAAHIRRHHIKATVACIDVKPGDANAGPAILSFAVSKNADLIAMGGYGHSRFREVLLGGLTEYLSRESKIPLLLTH